MARTPLLIEAAGRSLARYPVIIACVREDHMAKDRSPKKEVKKPKKKK